MHMMLDYIYILYVFCFVYIVLRSSYAMLNCISNWATTENIKHG